MKPEKIGAQESMVSLSRTEIAAIGRWALEAGEIDAAISFIGLNGIMEILEPASDTAQPELPFDETAADESRASETTKREKATSALWLGVKKIRGVRRPKEHRKTEYTYGSDY